MNDDRATLDRPALRNGLDLLGSATAVAAGLAVSLLHPVLGVATAAFVAASVSGLGAAVLATVVVAVGSEVLSNVMSAMFSLRTWVPAALGVTGALMLRRRNRTADR